MGNKKYCPNCGNKQAVKISEEDLYSCRQCRFEFIACMEFSK